MPREAEMPEEDTEETPEEEAAEDPYEKAFRVIRHAIADGDDEAGAEALENFVKLCEAHEDEEGEPKGRPNLAMILMGKKKKD